MGLHIVNAANIPQLTKTLLNYANGIPQFINAMEVTQRKSKWAKLVIQDEYIHPVAMKLLIQSGEYEIETRECSKLLDEQQTRTEWKSTFREVYLEKRQAEAARRGQTLCLLCGKRHMQPATEKRAYSSCWSKPTAKSDARLTREIPQQYCRGCNTNCRKMRPTSGIISEPHDFNQHSGETTTQNLASV